MAWTDSSNVDRFWRLAHELGGLFPPTPILVILKDQTIVEGKAIGFTTESNEANTSWQGTLKLAAKPSGEVIAIDYLDIETVEAKGTLN